MVTCGTVNLLSFAFQRDARLLVPRQVNTMFASRGFRMTTRTVLTKLTTVPILLICLLVTRIAIRGCALENRIGVALRALHIGMFPFQGKRHRLMTLNGERGGLPTIQRVTILAIIAKRALMRFLELGRT